MALQPIEIEAAGFSFWHQTTNHGTTISYESCNDRYRIGLRCKIKKNNRDICGHKISDLSKWYFYKKHIIGEYSAESEFSYFVFDEETCTISSFYKSEKHIEHIKSNKLKPLIWTRNYTKNHGIILTSGDFTDGYLWLVLKLPLLIIISIIIIIGFVRTGFKNRKFNLISICIIALVTIRLFLDCFPQSI
jgi:hypothetical protein